MKWRLARRFLAFTVLIIIIVTVVNSLMLLGALIWQSYNGYSDQSSERIEKTASNFHEMIDTTKNPPTISSEGKTILKDNHAWLQILDANGHEVQSYFTPDKLKKDYSPIDIVQMYKYQEVDGETTAFIGEAGKYSYFFGVQNQEINRFVFQFNYADLFAKISQFFILFLLIDILIAIAIGFLFGNRLTKPMNTLITGISDLKNKNYTKSDAKKGIYREVFENMNDLSTTLASVEKERKQLDQLREEWISNISHDMKTPLSSIQGYAELLHDSVEHLSTEELIEYTAIIKNKSLYMRDLLNDLNLTTRLKNAALPLNKEIFNSVSFIREIIIELLNDPAYSQKDLQFDFSDEELFIFADKKLLKRAVLNFVLNAFIHNPEGTTFEIAVNRGYPQQIIFDSSEKLSTNPIIISIADNGIGIPKDEQKNIFSRYYRGTNTKNTVGTGLGTAIANDIVVAHEGEIHLISEEHKGTTFYIVLEEAKGLE